MKINNPVAWFEIHVRGMARACAFYEGMLGVALTPLSDPAYGQTDGLSHEQQGLPGHRGERP